MIPRPERGARLSAREAMLLAIQEAAQGAPFVSPNPQVGCVILDAQGGFLSSGHHERYGGPHAEVNALKGLSDAELKDAKVFVTLEPCAHEGKTPSCAKHLARLPVAEVVYGLVDPNPLVSGEGARILQDAGKSCFVFHERFGAELDEALEEAAEIFLWNYRHRKVFVAMKAAISLDGRMATSTGQSQWITGPESREQVHRLRAALDGVLVGVGTFLADNPSLDIRLPNISKENFAIVIDPEGRGLGALSTSKLLNARLATKVVFAVAEERAAMLQAQADASGIRLLPVKRDQVQGLDIQTLLKGLWDLGLRSVLVEGGAVTNQSFLRAQAVQRLHLFQAPIVIGGAGAHGWSGQFAVPSLAEALVLRRSRGLDLGRDFYRTGLLQDPESGASYRNV